MGTQYTGQTFSLAQDINAGTTYLTIDFTFISPPPFTAGIIKVNKGEQSEWWSIENMALVAGETTLYRADVLARGLKHDATSTTDGDTTLQKDHSTTTTCTLVMHSLNWNAKAFKSGNNTFSGDNTVTGTLSFTGTTEAGLKLQQVTTAQRDTLTGTGTGTILYNTTTATAQVKDPGGSYDDLPTGDTNPNASETVAGKMKLGTVANQEAAAQDTNVIQTQYLKTSSSSTQTDDHGKIFILDSTGKLPYTILPAKGRKFGGDGSDGVLAGSLNVSGSDSTYIVKNFRSITGGSFTLTITPVNCVLHIKVLGLADFTNWTINLKGLGGPGGAVSTDISDTLGGTNTVTAPNNGQNGHTGTLGLTTTTTLLAASTGGTGGQSASGGTAGAASAVAFPYTTSLGVSPHFIYASAGSGGAQGAGGYNVDKIAGGTQPPYVFNGGAGGAGGGVIIIEAAGGVTFSSTNVDIRGNNGSMGSAGTTGVNNSVQACGSGGGGAGGTFFCIYNGVLTGSPTVALTGGTGGTAPAAGSGGGFSGGGGGGGSNIFGAGTNGTAGSANGTGGAGGNGADGKSFILANTVFS